MTSHLDIIQELEAASPSEPEYDPILTLHRGDNGFVAFARKPQESGGKKSKSLENLFSIQAGELAQMFPAIRHWLIADAYFSVNGMHRAGEKIHRGSGLPRAYRPETNLRYFNACYVDLDVGRDDEEDGAKSQQSWQQAAAGAIDLMERGLLPQASILARSGRGLYLFWLLHDTQFPSLPTKYWHNPDIAGDIPLSFPEKIVLYKQVNKALGRILRDQAADPAVFDAARILRTPGTSHYQNGTRATYVIRRDATGAGYSYTLPDLARMLDIGLVKLSLPPETRQELSRFDPTKGRQTKKPGTVPKRSEGMRSLHLRRLNDLVAMEQWHHGWLQGRRRRCLLAYAVFLRGSGRKKLDTLNAVNTMAGNCRPPYPSDSSDVPVQQIVDAVFTNAESATQSSEGEGNDLKSPSEPSRQGYRFKFSDETLIEWLQITPLAVEEADLQTILPADIKEARKPPKGGQRGIQRAKRQELIRDFCENYGAPSARRMQKVLEDQGLKASATIINAEMNALGYKPTGSSYKRVRPSAATGQNELPGTTPKCTGCGSCPNESDCADKSNDEEE